MALFNAVITGESTLSLTRTELLRAMGRKAFGGDYGEDPTLWSATDTTRINDMLASGLRVFYGAADWSFLWAKFRAKLEVGVAVYDLPEDFAGPHEELIYLGNWSGNMPIVQAQLLEVDREAARTNGNSLPTKFAIEALPHSGESQGQRFAIHFNAKAAAEYEIAGQYYVNPYALSSSRPYPLGGGEFGECLKWACLAQIEVDKENTIEGPAMAQFSMLLGRCKAKDQRNNAKILGINGTRKLVARDFPPIFTGDIRYNGTSVFGG